MKSNFQLEPELISVDALYELEQIRRQSTWELQIFKERWNKAIAADENWVDPFKKEVIKKWPKTRRQRHGHH